MMATGYNFAGLASSFDPLDSMSLWIGLPKAVERGKPNHFQPLKHKLLLKSNLA